MQRLPLLIAGFLLLSVVAMGSAPGQAAVTYVLLGKDPAGDDPEGWTNQANQDTSEADDIVELSVSLQGADVVFKIKVTELPDDADLHHGQTCWMPAFQVNGAPTEFVGLMCGNWYAGEFQGWVTRDTSRGTEVATKAELVAAEKAVLVTVPLAKISAKAGDRLTDLYALTYFDQPSPSVNTATPTATSTGIGSLYVGDAAPNAKSSAAAAVSYGNWTIGALVAGDVGGAAEPRVEFAELPAGPEATVALDLNETTSGVFTFNWTYDGGDLSIVANVSVLGGNLSAQVLAADNSTLWSEDWSSNDTRTGSVAGLEPATLRIVLNATEFAGTIAISLTTGSSTSGPAGTGPADPTATTNGTATAAGSPDDGKGSPGVPLVLAIGALVAIAAVRRRK